jgi:hypothetical protein
MVWKVELPKKGLMFGVVCNNLLKNRNGSPTGTILHFKKDEETRDSSQILKTPCTQAGGQN